MRQKRRCTHFGGPRMRPPDPDDLVKMASGVFKSMQVTGYDYPVRKLRRSGDVCCVTLPLQVRGFLNIKRGDLLVFGSTLWPGVAAFMRIPDEQYRSMTIEDRKAQQLTVRKVQGRKSLVFVTIPPAIRKMLSAEIGDLLHFSPQSVKSAVNICTVKGGGKERGHRRPGG